MIYNEYLYLEGESCGTLHEFDILIVIFSFFSIKICATEFSRLV